MKKYKIIVGGRGAECYVHRIDTEKKMKLTEGKVEQEKMDFEQIAEVLGVDFVTDCEDVFLGPYSNSELYQITVLDENENTVWQSENDHEFNDYQSEYKFENEQVLVIEDYSKGVFYEYDIELEQKFDPTKLTAITTEIIERVEIITGLLYEECDLSSFKDYGDYWSKGLTYYLN